MTLHDVMCWDNSGHWWEMSHQFLSLKKSLAVGQTGAQIFQTLYKKRGNVEGAG